MKKVEGKEEERNDRRKGVKESEASKDGRKEMS